MGKKKYLDVYYELHNEFPCHRGLCYVFNSYVKNEDATTGEWDWGGRYVDPYFKLVYPSPEESDGRYWGGEMGLFTDLRQNIVLLMAAMNNEL